MRKMKLIFLQKKKVIFFVLRAKVKKLRNWGKVPFFHFPHKFLGPVYYETPCMKRFVENLHRVAKNSTFQAFPWVCKNGCKMRAIQNIQNSF